MPPTWGRAVGERTQDGGGKHVLEAQGLRALFDEVRVRDKTIVSATLADPNYALLIASSEARRLRLAAPGGGPDERQGRVVMAATCIDGGQSAIDVTGTFDGTTFRLEDGSSTWEGTFDGATATLTGGPCGITLVFQVR